MDETGGVDDAFVRSLTGCQNRLYTYILSLLPDADRAKDVLQETNVVMWRKAHEFTPGTSFSAWACKVAYFEVLSERRRNQRDRHMFSETLLSTLASEGEKCAATLDERSVALDECLDRLSEKQRRRLFARYSAGGSVRAIAEESGKSCGAIATALYRVRASLLRCIEDKVAGSST